MSNVSKEPRVSRPVRMKDIARDLGVSAVTVSKALRDAPDIGREMKRLVRQRCKELNFHANLAARSLVTSKTFSVGLVVPDLLHSFFAEIAMGVARKLHPRGYTLVLSNSQEDPALEKREVERLLARSVDGILLASAQPPRGLTVFREIQARNVPLVLLDRRFPRLKCDFIGADNQELGRMATAHLIAGGCRHVAHVACPQISTGPPRLEGYRAALAGSGFPVSPELVVETENNGVGGYCAMQRLLQLRPIPDGVFCFSDNVAAGALKAILEAGLNVPDDVALIGAGNLLYSDFLRVPLSTVDLRCASIGEQAAGLLLERMTRECAVPARTVLMPLTLLVRESSRRAGNHS